jgi:hypothetical protein
MARKVREGQIDQTEAQPQTISREMINNHPFITGSQDLQHLSRRCQHQIEGALRLPGDGVMLRHQRLVTFGSDAQMDMGRAKRILGREVALKAIGSSVIDKHSGPVVVIIIAVGSGEPKLYVGPGRWVCNSRRISPPR